MNKSSVRRAITTLKKNLEPLIVPLENGMVRIEFYVDGELIQPKKSSKKKPGHHKTLKTSQNESAKF